MNDDMIIPENAVIYCDGAVKLYVSDGLKVMALQGLDLTVEKGEMIAIIGKSGSGKSTLLNMIGCVDKPSAGKVIVDGKDISTLSDADMITYRREKLGFVWQKSSRNLLKYLNVLENIKAPMRFLKMSEKERDKRAMELLEMLNMTGYAKKYPHQMSGGEQQRIAIAVALACKPKILLADEPTGAVDTNTTNAILELFNKLNKEMGITIVIVTHDSALADKVPRTVMISDGKISTEKVRLKDFVPSGKIADDDDFNDGNESDTHNEYSILDKANRVQLSKEMLKEAGITSNKVKIETVDGKIVISSADI